MADTFLTRDEVIQLTGSHRKQGQIDLLARQGVRFFVNKAGWPVVPRNVLEVSAKVVPIKETWAPAKAGKRVA